MCRLNKFCWCSSVRTGCFVVGTLELLFAVLTLFPSIGFLIELQYDRQYRMISENYNSISAFGYWNLGYVVIEIIVYAQTVYGTNKGKQLLLLPYLLFNGFNICLSVPIVIILIIQSGAANFDTISIIGLILFSILTAIKIYFWMIIYSYYHEIREEKYYLNSTLPICVHSSEHDTNNKELNV